MSGWLCVVPFAASLFAACSVQEPLVVGYVEGEYVLVAPIANARIASLTVRRGDALSRGEIIAVLDKRDAELALAKARAARAQAEAKLRNLEEGKREQEIAVIEATLRSANSQTAEARRQHDRLANLAGRGFVSLSDLEDSQTNLEMAEAKVAQLAAELSVARLPARSAEITAAKAALEEAQSAVETAQWQLSERTLYAPANGRIADVILRTGEISGPSAPLVSFLPDDATRLKLFVPQQALSSLSTGTRLEVRCDGCEGKRHAVVSYISNEPEFTPPVIYSVGTRQKLVYLVEARPEPTALDLKPGQIVDIVIAEPAR